MPREDITESVLRKCPCGEGKVVLIHYAMDHGYGSGSTREDIHCGRCAREWSIRGQWLVRIASTAPIEVLECEEKELRAEWRGMGQTALRRALDGRTFRYKTHELAELQRLGFHTHATIEMYRNSRRNKEMWEVVDAGYACNFIAANSPPEAAARAQEIAARLRAIEVEKRCAEAKIERVPLHG